MKFFAALLLSFFLPLAITAQTTSISGTIKDPKDGSPLIGAGIALLKTDSTLISGTTADVNGNFKLENVPLGNFLLKISFLGYENRIRPIQTTAEPLQLGNIPLRHSFNQLKDVVIEDKAPTATQKGDTTQYNANSYKTNPDANAEDLITKMSGITSQDGKVQAHGEDVKKILVDGKPFFGDDPNAALKNLPAEVIDKIQVFDQQTDQSKFTGVNDGNTTKTINIITKPGMKNGTFGRVYGGYGYEDVYKAGGTINFFEGDRRITLLAQSNNISEQNFSSEDLAGVMSSNDKGGNHGGGGMGKGGPGMMGGGGGYGSYGQNNSSNFLVNTKNGLATTHAFGLNYTDKWGAKTDVATSYFFNYSNTEANQYTTRNYILPADTGRVYQETSNNTSTNINHRINVRIDFKPDTNNAITFTPKFSLQQNDGSSRLNAHTNKFDTLLNATINSYRPNITASNTSGELLLMHKFKKQGRTISLNLNGGYATSEGKNTLAATNNYYSDSSITITTQNQQTTLDKITTTLGANLTYTEPAGKKGILQLSYSNSFTLTSNDKQTFNYVALSSDYSLRDTTLSNVFKSDYITHKAGVAYRFNSAKLNFMAGLNYQLSSLQSTQDFPFSFDLSRSYGDVLPSLMMKYNFTSKKSLRIMYRASTNQPAIEQLQNVLNNSNPLQLSIGNEQLRPNYDNMLFMRYSATNTDKGSSFFAMLAGNVTANYIANSTYTATNDTMIDGIHLSRGAQLTKPVNMNGYFNLRSFITYGIPVSIIRCNLNLNASAGYTRTPGLVNDQTNLADGQSYGGGLTLSSNISKDIDFSLSTNTSYNFTTNSINTSLNTSYLNQNSKLKVSWIIKNSLVVATDLTHQYYSGLSAGYNTSYLLWNAGLGYKFMKDKQAELRASVNDILGQNTSITRNTTETYLEDVRVDVLQRYYMLTFTYNIKVFKKKPTAGPDGGPTGGMPGMQHQR